MHVGTFMTRDPITDPGLSEDTSMKDAMLLLRTHKIRHLPLANGKQLVGLVSDRDIRRARRDARYHADAISQTDYTSLASLLSKACRNGKNEYEQRYAPSTIRHLCGPTGISGVSIASVTRIESSFTRIMTRAV